MFKSIRYAQLQNQALACTRSFFLNGPCMDRQTTFQEIEKYRKVVGPQPTNELPTNPYPACAELQEFIRFVIREFTVPVGRYELKFMSSDNVKNQDFDLCGYVSWLVVERVPNDHENGRLWILYDPNEVARLLLGVKPPDFFCNSKELSTRHLYRIFRTTMSKILLHETAHALEHLDNLIETAQRYGERMPVTQPLEENEAWFFALCLWGILTGDRAHDVRNSLLQDDAWLMA